MTPRYFTTDLGGSINGSDIRAEYVFEWLVA